MPDQTPGPRTYRFGPFEADTRTRILRKQGHRIRLQYQPFQVLVFLLERSGQLVTRDELHQRLWPGDTFVDFEHGLNAAVNKLRQALNDSADEPRYVETLARLGYRFLAPVELIAAAPTVPHPLAGVDLGAQITADAVRVTQAGEKPVKWWWIGAGVLACAAIFGVWYWKSAARTTQSTTDAVTVLIGDFDNTTGDAVFDSTLRQALAIQLEQSPFIHLISEERTREALRYMGRSPDERITPLLGMEICQRERVNALVAGSIAALGSHYLISLNAVRCQDGSSIARQQMEAENKEVVLHILDQGVVELRGKLGESLNSIQKYNIRLEEASTPSVEAMKAYSVGLETRVRGKEAEAIPFFKHAIELDPKFATAYARLGTSYFNIGESALGAEYLKKAFALHDRVSEQERFYIDARYYDGVTGEVDKAIETYELWRQIYPQDALPYTNLAAEYLELGSYEKAVEAARTALRINPDHSVSYANLVEGLCALGRLSEAREVSQQAIHTQRDIIDIHLALYGAAFADQDTKAMQAEVQWAHTRQSQEEMYMWSTEASAAASSGKFKLAQELFRRSEEIAVTNGFRENAGFSIAQEALFATEFGELELARHTARKALEMSQGEAEQAVAALALARSGELVLAQKVAVELDRRYPLSTRSQKIYLPIIRAAIALSRGNTAEAIELLRIAQPYELGTVGDLMPVYVRAQAYLRARDGRAAAAEFQKILDHRGINLVSPLYSLSYLGVGRSSSLAGDVQKSRKAYEMFLSAWKDGDPDLPVIKRARNEYFKK